jgi:hypothetical protein
MKIQPFVDGGFGASIAFVIDVTTHVTNITAHRE